MKKTLFLLFGVALSFTSCQNDDNVDNNTPKFTIKADFDNDARTIVDNDGKVKWEIGDKIDVMHQKSLFDPIQTCTFTASELSQEDKIATFTTTEDFQLDADESGYVALYPSGIFDEVSDFPIFTCTLPGTQTYDAVNMVATKCNPAVALETKNDFEANRMFHFKNVCGLLRLKFVGDVKITSIEFFSSGTEYICGKFTCNPQTATLTAKGVGGTWIVLDCGEGVQLNPDTPTEFYIVLPPATYTSFDILAHYEGEFLPNGYRTTHSHTITRSKIHTISTLTCNAAF